MKKISCKVMLLLALLLSVAPEGYAQYQKRRTSSAVYFPFNKYFLTDSAKARIDEMIYSNAIDDRSALSIIGYADFVGGEDYNLSLSQKRADAVKDYLIASGFKAEAITIIIGKGKIERKGIEGRDGYAPDRRVDIVRSRQSAPTKPKDKDQSVARVPHADTLLPTKRFSETKDVKTLQPGQTLVLDKIFFYPGRHIIRPESAPALESLYTVMEENQRLKIRIEGHVCCIRPNVKDALDEDSGGLNLSSNRAFAIREWLLRKGVDADRISWKGFGKSHPVILNEATEEEADQNRRVEIRIIEK